MDFQLDYFRQLIYLINNNLGLQDDDVTVQTVIAGEIQAITKRIDSYQPDDISRFTGYIHFQLCALTRTAKEIEDIVSFKNDLPDDMAKCDR